MSIPDVSKAINIGRVLSESTEDLSKFLTTGKKIISLEKEFAKYKDKFTKVQDLSKLNKEFQEVKNKYLKTEKVIDTVLKKVPGKDTAAKALGASNMLGALAIMGAQAGITAFAAWVSNFVQDTQDKTNNLISEELTKINGRTLANTSLIRKQQQQIDGINKKVASTTDKIYAEAAGAAKNATIAREKANEALYETRANKPKLEAQIAEAKKKANDALYETRQGRAKLESDIATVKKQANDALYETRAGRTKTDEKIAAIQSQLKTFTQGVSANFLSTLQTTVNNVQANLKTADTRINNLEKTKTPVQTQAIEAVQSAVKKVGIDLSAAVTRLAKVEADAKTIDPKIANLKDFTVKLVTGSVTPLETKVNENKNKIQEVERKGVTATTVDGLERSLRSTYDQSFEAQAAKFNEQIRQQQTKIDTVTQVVTTTTTGGEIAKIKADVDKLKTGNEDIKKDITKLDTKIKDQEKVNQAAIPKLDQILGLIPAIPARAAAAIRPDIPTIPQIEQASATGTCRTLQPGGCSRKAFDDLGNSVNQNTNNQSKNLFDKLNAGANAAQLALLETINTKLGGLIPGGLSGKLVDGFKWLHLDRALNLLTFAATVQNHLMLSNDIGQTLIGAFTNVLTLIGLKDDKGEAFDIGSVINSTVENFVKGIVGADNYAALSNAWAKANRIYQATTNVLNSFLNLSQVILQANELIASYTGKIGNALKNGGVILENAYGWMNPQPKFNRITGFLQGLQQGASTVQMVTQAPLDVVNATTELTTASTAFVTAIKEDTPENKSTPTAEPDALKAEKAKAKTDSQPLAFDFSDLFDGED